MQIDRHGLIVATGSKGGATISAAWAKPAAQRDGQQAATVKAQSRRRDANVDNMTEEQVAQQAWNDANSDRYRELAVRLEAILKGSESLAVQRQTAMKLKAELEGDGKGRELLKQGVLRHLGGGTSGSQWCRDVRFLTKWKSTFGGLGIHIELPVTDPKPNAPRKRPRT